jgi:hypothetical protein
VTPIGYRDALRRVQWVFDLVDALEEREEAALLIDLSPLGEQAQE